MGLATGGCKVRGAGLALACLVLGALGQAVSAREIATPAELPPADFRGQQYVDSKGCLFMRAGDAGQTVWIPRVTREGVALCGNPPSGGRVPVEGEADDPDQSGAAPALTPAPETAPALAVAGDYVVAVGSFSVAGNVDKAAARLLAMGYPVMRGRLQGGSGSLVTVFAGPFADAATATEARLALRSAGFADAVVIGP